MALISRTVLLFLLALFCGGVLAKAYHYDEEDTYETAVWNEDDFDESFPSEGHASYEVDEDADEADLEEEDELDGSTVAPARQLPVTIPADDDPRLKTVHKVPGKRTGGRKGTKPKKTFWRKRQARKYKRSEKPLKGKAYTGKRGETETPEDFAQRNEARKNMEKNKKRMKPTRKEDDGTPSGAQLRDARRDPFSTDHLAVVGLNQKKAKKSG